MKQEMDKTAENKEKSERPKVKQETEMLVRILQTDIPGSKNLFSGLSRIKGVSFSVVNSVCKNTGIDKKRKISSLSPQEIDKLSKINSFLATFPSPTFVAPPATTLTA